MVTREPITDAQLREIFTDLGYPIEAEREIARLAGLIRRRVVSELRWDAEKHQSVGYHKDAYRLRRQADRFEASHV